MQKIEDQPPPIEQSKLTPAWELVIADVEKYFSDHIECDEPIVHQVLSDMRERDAAGRARYGVPLTACNGRDHLVDAYQEALDLTVYLRAWLDENPRYPVAKNRRLSIRRMDIANLYESQLKSLWHLRWIMSELAEAAAPLPPNRP